MPIVAADPVTGLDGPVVVGPGEELLFIATASVVIDDIIVEDGGRLVVDESTLVFVGQRLVDVRPGGTIEVRNSSLLLGPPTTPSPLPPSPSRFRINANGATNVFVDTVSEDVVQIFEDGAIVRGMSFLGKHVGLNVSAASLTIESSLFRDSVTGVGAGFASLTVVDSRFENVTTGIRGVLSGVTVRSSSFTAGTTAIDAFRGTLAVEATRFNEHVDPPTRAIRGVGLSSATVSGSTFTDWGGAVELEAANATIADNAFSTSLPRDVEVFPSPTPALRLGPAPIPSSQPSGHYRVANNTITGWTGGIFAPRVENATFENNTISGARNGFVAGGNLTFINNTVQTPETAGFELLGGNVTMTGDRMSSGGYGVIAAPAKDVALVVNLTRLTVQGASWAAVLVGEAHVDVWMGNFTNSNDGIWAGEGSEVVARASYFAGNFHSGLFALPGSDVVGDHNWFQGNLNLGAGCPANNVFFPMTDSYWGHPDGPTVSSNPGGVGDRVSESVDYSGFLSAPPF